MKLVKKSERVLPKKVTRVWVTEEVDGKTVKRKLFTCYDIALDEIERIMLSNFNEK